MAPTLKTKPCEAFSEIYLKHHCCVKNCPFSFEICRRTFFLELFDTQALFIQAKWFTKENAT